VSGTRQRPELGAGAECGDSRFRTIRSFVRREGRITPGQTNALAQYLEHFSVPPDEQLNFDAIFGRDAPTYLEIGSGNGQCIAALAKAYPANNYLAVEVHRPGIGHLLQLAVETKLENLRIVAADVQTLLPRLRPESITGVYIFFPDPWPKLRHHKRRLLQGDFLTALRPCLQRHGRINFATDSGDYAERVMTFIANTSDWINLAGSARSPRLKLRPCTRFESRGIAAGREIYDFTFARA